MVIVKTSSTIEGLDILNTLTNIMSEAFLTEIANRIKYTTEDSIESEIFTTKLGTKVTGIVNLGDYLNSYEIDDSDLPKSITIGSTDENAKEIEEGRFPDRDYPKDSEIIQWVRDKKFAGRRFISVGQRIARYIRRNGIAPKPAFSMGMERAKVDIVEIKNRTIDRLKIKLNG